MVCQQADSLTHFQFTDIFAETHARAVLYDALQLPFTVMKKGGEFRKGDGCIMLLHIFQEKDKVFALLFFLKDRQNHVGTVIPEQDNEKSVDDGMEHPVFVLAAVPEFMVGIADTLEQFLVASGAEQKKRMGLGVIERVHKEIRQDVVFGQNAEESLFKGACAQKDVENNAFIGKSPDGMPGIGCNDADISFPHGKLLSRNQVCTASFRHTDDFQKIMGMQNGGQIAEMAVQSHIESGTEEAVFTERVGKESGQEIKAACFGEGFFQQCFGFRQFTGIP